MVCCAVDSSVVLKMFSGKESVLETLAVGCHLFLMLPARIIAMLGMIYFLFYGSIWLQFFIIFYWIYVFWDSSTPSQGGRRWDGFRDSWYFKYIAQYFSMKLVQKAELPSDRNYIVVFHPHGIWFFACTLAFAADVFHLEMRKGLRTFISTINSNFSLPLAREYLLATGFISVSEKSIKYLLTDPKGGNLVCLLPGGSAEAGFSEPGHYRILLKTRKGFCRVALQTGAWLVPTFSFGEVDCYRTTKPSGYIIQKFQQLMMRWIGVNPVLYQGYSSNLYFLALPKRTPITVVMGEPIPVTENKSPTRGDIEDLHNIYIQSIQKLFEAEKHKYLENANNTHLVIQ